MNTTLKSPVLTSQAHSRCGKILARATAALAAAGLTAIAFAGFAAAGPASAATTTGWEMTAGNVQSLSQQDSATAAHFFNTPASYGAGASLVKTPVQAGYATTPVLGYTSYAQFASDIKNGSISYPYKWVMYDAEKWSATPVGEQQNPIKYMRLFGQLAHAHGFKVIMAPALDLGAVSGSVLPRQPGESLNAWWVRVNISGAAGRSVTADGFYVAAPGAIPQADQFFKAMHTAGY